MLTSAGRPSGAVTRSTLRHPRWAWCSPDAQLGPAWARVGGGSGPSSGHMTLVPPSGRGEGRECGVGVTRAWGNLSRGRGGSWPGSEAGPAATMLEPRTTGSASPSGQAPHELAQPLRPLGMGRLPQAATQPRSHHGFPPLEAGSWGGL